MQGKAAGKTCGDCGGRNADGSPCGRPAGWGLGRDVHDGKCRRHGAEADAVLQDKKKRVLEAIANPETSLQDAAKAVDVDPTTVWRWRQDDADFDRDVRAVYDRADSMRVQLVEESLFRRLVDGKATGTELIFFLTNRAPDRWKHVSHMEHSGPAGGPIPVHGDVTFHVVPSQKPPPEAYEDTDDDT